MKERRSFVSQCALPLQAARYALLRGRRTDCDAYRMNIVQTTINHVTALVVDTSDDTQQTVSLALKDRIRLLRAKNRAQAIALFQRHYVDLVFLSVLLPDGNGLELLRHFKSTDPEVDVVMLTSVKDMEIAEAALKWGASDYVTTPVEDAHLVACANELLNKPCAINNSTRLLPSPLAKPFERMMGQSRAMKNVFNLIERISTAPGAVLIQGESGTGKELVARALHNRSTRSAMPFVVVNAATPELLVESELFGHSRGAFTGATEARTGKLEFADGGTVFLDDIDSLHLSTQTKLLRVIQEKEFSPVGSNRTRTVDVRFVAASNKNLLKLIKGHRFREDLYYRLNVYPLHVPPLRERRKDVPLLLTHFMRMNAEASGSPEKHFTSRACETLLSYSWPGNVRELQNLVERLFTITPGRLIHRTDVTNCELMPEKHHKADLKTSLRDHEMRLIQKALVSENGNRTAAARRLGIHRNTLRAKINGFTETTPKASKRRPPRLEGAR